MSKAKKIDPLFKAWDSCQIDQDGDGGKMINCALLEKASRLLYQRKLQQTVDKLLNSGRMEKIEEYIDLNYKMHTVATLSYGEVERDGMDEFHLLGIPGSGTEADFARYQEPQFRSQLQERVNQHLEKLLAGETKGKRKPRFDCEISLNLIDADIFGSSSSDVRKAILEEFAEKGTISFTVQREGEATNAVANVDKSKQIHTKLIVVGFGCAEKDFTDSFVLNDMMLDYVTKSEVWKGSTLSGGSGSTLLPPMPINSASLLALSRYIKDFMWNQLAAKGTGDLGTFEMNYSAFEEILSLRNADTNVVYALEIPRKWFFACGLNSIDILKSSLEIEDEDEAEDTDKDSFEADGGEEEDVEMALLLDDDEMADTSVGLQLEGEQRPLGTVMESEEERAWNEELDRILPSFWNPKKHTVN